MKHDGFRELAYVEHATTRFVSRNGRTFASWPDLCADIADELRADGAVRYGEVVCLNARGCINHVLYDQGSIDAVESRT